jgi:magnesium transporter
MMNQSNIFTYFSDIYKTSVYDSENRYVGKLFDIALFLREEIFPSTDHLILSRGLLSKRYAHIPMKHVKNYDGKFVLNIKCDQVHFDNTITRADFSLRRDILDQQIVDTNDQKVVRVNDAHFLRVDNHLYLAHVDVGLRGLVRRLGWTPFIDAMVRLFKPTAKYLTEEELISWKHTHLLTIGQKKNVIRSDVAKKLVKIPTAELAEIMNDLGIFEKLTLFKTLPIEIQREVFTDMVIEEKEELIEHLEEKEAGNLIEHIPADEATDLLRAMTREKRTMLLRHLHTGTSRDLRKLLGFSQDTAGGLMTKEYLYLDQNALVEDGLQKIKDNVDFPGNPYFIYLVDEHHHLVGVTALRKFIHCDPKMKLIDTCYPKNVFVNTHDGMEEIALLLEKFKFSSIPVLGEDDLLQGVITIDDVMEELISLAWRKYKDKL